MKIATWNVNSIKARLANVRAWLGDAVPDVALLQETKTVAEAFPASEFEELGYNLAVAGQKSYNGVAILSKHPIEDVVDRLPGDEGDDQARYIEGWIDAGAAGIRVASIYLPNGNPTDSPKYPYKLAWMDRLGAHARALLAQEEPVILGGDYNVVPADGDVYDPAGWADDALCRPETRARFRALVHLGYTDAFRALHREGGRYSFWDYQRRAFEADRGLRIDHLLLSPQAADRLEACDIDPVPRGWAKASDHTPVWCVLSAQI
ncbi:MAG: exodeoxyribonuclease III [Alphaproteobacteria bacterium]|jgi:exodeoxyribonuclease-3|nr:exodeoxyribonuclease III [Alphaproteobacteria bacterium]MDP6517973.1 exodeoxyribonuclease III [Alphaproteobacteria bacterium]